MHTTTIPPQWWSLAFGNDRERMIHLHLLFTADRDGLTVMDSAVLSAALHTGRLEVVAACRALAARGYLGLYDIDSKWYAWVPHAVSWQPTSGKHKRQSNIAVPPPPKDVVRLTLETLWGRSVTLKDAKWGCPRAWGKRGKAAPTDTAPTASVQTVWEAWRDRQKRPGACKLGSSARKMIESALREADCDQLVLLFRYAYEADEPGPRFWRGENRNGATYLGLDNLLRLQKLPGRIQLALEWRSSLQKTHTEGDGTSLGPMAAYRASRRSSQAPGRPQGAAEDPGEEEPGPGGRRGPKGTLSTSPDGSVRLSAQCKQMLALFIQRGEQGVRTSELAEIARKYTGRISELRGAGVDIVLVERSKEGDNLYCMINAEGWNADVVD